MAGYFLPAPAILRRVRDHASGFQANLTDSARWLVSRPHRLPPTALMEADAPFASHCGGVYAILGVRDTSNIILTTYIGVSRLVSQRIVSHATSIISKKHDVTISGTGQQFVHAGIVQLGVEPRYVLLAKSDDADELKWLEGFFVFAMGTFNHPGWQQLRAHFTQAPGPLLARLNLSPCTENAQSLSQASIPSAMYLRIRYNRFRAKQRTMFAEDAETFHAAQRELRELRQDEESLALRHGTLAVSAVGSSPTSARVIYLKVGDIGLPAAVGIALLTSLSRIGHSRLATVVSIPRGQKEKTLGDAREATNTMPSQADHLILGLSVTRDGSTFERLTTIKPELTRLGLIVTLELDGRTSAAPLQFAHNEHNSTSYLPDLADLVWSSLSQSEQASRLQMRSATSTERHNLLRSSISPFAKTLVNGTMVTFQVQSKSATAIDFFNLPGIDLKRVKVVTYDAEARTSQMERSELRLTSPSDHTKTLFLSVADTQKYGHLGFEYRYMGGDWQSLVFSTDLNRQNSSDIARYFWEAARGADAEWRKQAGKIEIGRLDITSAGAQNAKDALSMSLVRPPRPADPQLCKNTEALGPNRWAVKSQSVAHQSRPYSNASFRLNILVL